MKKNEVTLYQHASRGGIKYIRLWTDGADLKREWGLKGTKNPQTSSDTKVGMNIGRANETTPEEQAKLELDRLVKKKMEEGYVRDLKDEVKTFSLDNPTKSFCPAKPVQELPEGTQVDIITRKRDGFRTLTFVDSKGEVRLYSRRMDNMTEHFPTIIASLKKMVKDKTIPVESILDGEMIVTKDGADDFKAISQIYRSKAPLAIEKQAALDGALQYYLFDIIHWEGKEFTLQDFSDRLKVIPSNGKDIVKIEVINATLEKAKKMVEKNEWEGLVAYSNDYHNTITLDGKPKRPKGAYKVKPVMTDEMIVTNMSEGNGKNSGKLGFISLAQYDKNGKLVDCGDCGSGFSDEQRVQYWKEWKNKLGKIVVEVEFAERQDSGKLRFPTFLRHRTDKDVSECVFDGE